MNLPRRKFLQLFGGITATFPFLSFGKTTEPKWVDNSPPKRTELEDLYEFVESRTMRCPIKGLIPFKLFPFQKEILKYIHENRFTLFVKARQIGMTSLVTAYSVWAQQRQNAKIYGASANYWMTQYWVERFAWFGGKGMTDFGMIDDKHGSWPHPDNYTIAALDELNFDNDSSKGWIDFPPRGTQDRNENLYTFDSFLYQLYDEMTTGYVNDKPAPGKLIVYGTPDLYGNLRRAWSNCEYSWNIPLRLPKMRAYMFPADRCEGLWTPDRILNAEIALGAKSAITEIHAKLI